MGECGCGEVNYIKAYKVNDVVLAIGVYEGCHYCNNGFIGIDIGFFTDKNQFEKEYQIKIEKEINLEEAEFIAGMDSGELKIKLFDTEDFSKDEEEIIPDNEFDKYDMRETFNLKEWVRDSSLNLVQNAIDKGFDIFDNFKEGKK